MEPPGLSFGWSWASHGRLLGALGALLGSVGALLGLSYALLGRSWGALWRILWLLCASRPLRGRSGGSQEPPDTHFGTILRAFGDDLGRNSGTISEVLGHIFSSADAQEGPKSLPRPILG